MSNPSIMRRIGSRLRLRLGSHYRRSLVTILLLSSLPGLVIGFIIFVVSTSQIEQELHAIHRDEMVKTAESIHEHFSDIEQFAAHWAFDPNFSDHLSTLDLAADYKQVHDIYQTLLVMEGSNALVDHVELYVNAPNPIVFSKNGYHMLNDDEAIARYDGLLMHAKTLYWHDSFRSPVAGRGDLSPVSLIHKIPGDHRSPFGAFIVYLDHDKAIRLVETLTPYRSGATIIAKEDGKRLFAQEQSGPADGLGQAVMQQVLARNAAAEHFLFDWEGETYSVTSGFFPRLDTRWFYMSAAPLSSITSPLVTISKLIIALNGLIVVAAIMIAWLATRKLYSPIDKLMKKFEAPRHRGMDADAGTDAVGRNEFEWIEHQWKHLTRESQTLQRRLDQQLPHLQKGFLLQLLQGYLYAFTEEELRDRMEHYGWEADGRRFLVVLIRLLGFSKLEGRFSEGDEGLVTFAAENIVRDLIRIHDLQADVVNFHDLSIGVMISLPDAREEDDARDELQRFSHEIISYIQKYLRLQVIVSMSRATESIKRIPALFEESKLALSFRNVQGGNQIIDQGTGGAEALEFVYPFDAEKELTQAIRLGQEGEASVCIRRFLAELSENNANELMMKQCVMQLLGSVLHIVLQSGLSFQELYGEANLYEQLGQLREADEIADWFELRIVHPFIRELSAKLGSQGKRAVEQVVLLLNEAYMTDISLDTCADHVKMSPFILSKLFKETTGTNFIDYLTAIRLNKAKELLRDTDLKIHAVAESVGYQHSYFNRIFKKSEGVTPSRYRETCRAR